MTKWAIVRIITKDGNKIGMAQMDDLIGTVLESNLEEEKASKKVDEWASDLGLQSFSNMTDYVRDETVKEITFDWTDYVWIDSATEYESDFLMSQIKSNLTPDEIKEHYNAGFFLSTKDRDYNFGLREVYRMIGQLQEA